MSNIFFNMSQAAGAFVELVYEKNGSDVSRTLATSATFTDVYLGQLPASDQTRYIIIVESGGAGGENTDVTTTVTIDGGAATRDAGEQGTSTSYRMWSAVHSEQNTTSEYGTVSFSASASRTYSFQVYAVYLPAGSTLGVHDSATDAENTATTLSISLDTPTSTSFMFVASQFRNGESTPSLSYGGTAGISTDTRIDNGTDENGYYGSKEFLTDNTGLTITMTDGTATQEKAMAGVVYKEVTA